MCAVECCDMCLCVAVRCNVCCASSRKNGILVHARIGRSTQVDLVSHD